MFKEYYNLLACRHLIFEIRVPKREGDHFLLSLPLECKSQNRNERLWDSKADMLFSERQVACNF